MKNLKALSLALPLLLLCMACSSDDNPNLIEFETIAISDQSPTSPGRSEHVINSEEAYEALLGTNSTVDFNRETVIAVFLGPTGNDNNTFEITEVIDNTSSITVKIVWQIPRILSGPNSNHYHVVKTRKLSRSINFSTTEVRL